jgi:hypothetical protein
MREIKFRAFFEGRAYFVETREPSIKRSIRYKGWYKENGYVMRLVSEHPFANKRGYVPEHRLVIESKIGRFLVPRKELVHHIDGNRSNNEESNLKITSPSEHFYEEHFKGRNPNGQFVAIVEAFGQIKFRLHNLDTSIVQIYTLRELMSKTFRRAKFEFRGRFTGLKDKNEVEIYEGDITQTVASDGKRLSTFEIKWCEGLARFRKYREDGEVYDMDIISEGSKEVIGNIYQNPDLLK